MMADFVLTLQGLEPELKAEDNFASGNTSVSCTCSWLSVGGC